MANPMLALTSRDPSSSQSPDLRSCLLCLQGAERKIRDEERKQSKRKGKCAAWSSQRMPGCSCVLPAAAQTLQSAGWMGRDWHARASTKAFPSSCGGGQGLPHRTAGHVLGGLRPFRMLQTIDQAGLQVIEREQTLPPECWDNRRAPAQRQP